jgi:hypothetical protein
MTRFEWDGLRKGDALFVHHPVTSQGSATRGDVEFVTVRAGHGNEIGIRLTGGGGPRRVAVVDGSPPRGDGRQRDLLAMRRRHAPSTVLS